MTDNKTKDGKNQELEKQQPKEEKAPKKRIIYRHHRTFIGGGLVGLVILSVLVGFGTIPLLDKNGDINIKVLGNQSYLEQPRKPVISRTEVEESNTHIDFVDTPEQEGELNPFEKIDKAIAARPKTEISTLQSSVERLASVIEAQQQMIRMLSQKQEKIQKEYSEQIHNISLQLTYLSEHKQATQAPVSTNTTDIQQQFLIMQLRQDLMHYKEQWVDGSITVDSLRNWADIAGTAGFTEAKVAATDTIAFIEDNNIVNYKNLIEQVYQISTKGEQTNNILLGSVSEGNLWERTKQRLGNLFEVRRIDSNQAIQTSSNPYDRLSSLVINNDINLFWQELMLLDEELKKQDNIMELRKIVGVYMAQKAFFDTAYNALTPPTFVIEKTKQEGK